MELRIPQFEDLKGRLGFKGSSASSSQAPQDEYSDGYQDEYFDDYGEYGYDDSADYTEYEAASSRIPAHASGSSTLGLASSTLASAGSANRGSSARLVSAQDVRAHTRYTPSASEEGYTTRASRVAAQPASIEEPSVSRDLASIQREEQRSPGLNGLFVPSSTPISSAPGRAMVASSAEVMRSQRQEVFSSPASEPAPAATSVPAPKTSSRILTVIKPVSYNDAERVSRIIKTGDVAVISLRGTSEALGKRILDFSFGVACALEAQVELVSAQVYAICRGAELSESEKARLREQGL